eukprot:Nitzschia sp. Nitz4//scaffold298_size22859//3579//4653//NITZ4_008527-RA/size22859-snap-gene-0.7-mRNA-1//1//CDS//3329546317//1169//frame0
MMQDPVENNDSNKVPSDAMMTLLAPDGYYTYLGVPKSEAGVDPDVIKKNYRKLSLKHHPDRSGGDADTFRLLNRAQKVLASPKLRQQYDVLGLDLDDDDEDQHGNAAAADEKKEAAEDQTTSQGIVHEIATMALTSVLQIGVRTCEYSARGLFCEVMMAVVSLFVARYIWTVLAGMAFLAFIAYRIHSVAGAGTVDILSPFAIGAGLALMHQSYYSEGWFVFWLGESIVIGMFTFNSMSGVQKSPPLYLGIAIFSTLLALWFRGKFWNYVIVLALELFLAIFIAMAFPVMEMVLEAVLNDKLRKVGDKVRAHHEYMERYYQNKR